MPEHVPIFTRSLFEFQSQFCRPFGTCYCGSRAVNYTVSDDQFMVPDDKVQVEGNCLDCRIKWKEIFYGPSVREWMRLCS